MKLRSTKSAGLIILALITLGLSNTAASASHGTPLECAADEYRDAMLRFEREVNQAREFGRAYERLADDLEDASGRLRSASRNLKHPERLLRAWAEVQFLHPRVEQTFFSLPPTRTLSILAVHWDRVACAYESLAVELQCVNHPHRYAAGRFDTPLVPRTFDYQTRYGSPSITQGLSRDRSTLMMRHLGNAKIGATLQRRLD
ncbi:hypothetical protein N9N28_04280 [Rubripirellula amarantea]|uniref:Uncharacterized protein n=1 Tax=Rubripirellula amarantea TaxID=2527999 RepID=A0A5C5WGK9_9BACT|nr:hypothetical protein [Rubripirellula amarantea]MDA8743833.1 hypothetical protein [Rubripirellula amarantea]TWT49677.1 hypothetical protein Pla22_48750 [Rubripirellula amarantea]